MSVFGNGGGSKEAQAAVATMRLGLGARPGELERVRADPRGWLHAQVSPVGAEQPAEELPGSVERLADLHAVDASDGAARDRLARAFAEPEAYARIALAAETPESFRERWALFWINHFSVHVDDPANIAVIGPYEREAIRPYVFGRFADLARAALKHPALLFYYHQLESAGPQSRTGGGVNENLARELLELHTVGREAGYSQADVREVALVLTGLGVAGPDEPNAHQFVFRDDRHQPGARPVMGQVLAEGGEAQVDALLEGLALKPETARFLATKVARHFVSDQPPVSLVQRLAAAYLHGGGSLGEMAHALIDAPETWEPSAAKFKTPYDLYLSVLRARESLPASPGEPGHVLFMLEQPLWQPGSPRGWSDAAAAWAHAAGLAKRVSWIRSSPLARGVEAEAMAQAALGARVRSQTLSAVRHARSGGEGAAAATLFMSPEFQWR